MTGSLLAVLLAATLGSRPLYAQVVTWHNDIGRTGQNTNETTLTQSNVTENKFGRLCSATLDGMVYSQPLVLTNVVFQGQTAAKTIAYVVTQNDSVYAIDTSNCTVLPNGHKQLLQASEEAATCADIGNNKICPVVGILGTPVIELTNILNPCCTTGTLYAVAESECPAMTQCNSTKFPIFFHRLYALDITSLAETNGGHVQICPSGCGNGKYLTGSEFSITHYNRPGLLFLNSIVTGGNNMVYAAFSMIDGGGNNPNGFIWAYDAHDLSVTPLSYETTPGANKRRGGIWQNGAGLVASKDANGSYYIYFSTGDGDFDLDQQQPPNTDAGDTFVKLNTDLSIPSGVYYFTPSDAYWRGCPPPNFNDKDFGSGGTLAIPEQTFSPPKFYAVKMDKENFLWVMDRTLPGGYNGGNSNYQYCGSANYSCTNPCQAPNNNAENFQFTTAKNCNNQPCEDRSAPAFWSGAVSSGDQGELYLAGTYDQLTRYAVSANCTPGPICNPASATTNVDPNGTRMGYSATPSVSSNGTTLGTGVVWAIKSNGGTGAPVLYAFKADTLAELYDTGQCFLNHIQVDQPGVATTFSVPTIANGRAYIGTQTDFDIYGPLTRTCAAQ
jgi:hypothetical protein